MYDLMNSYIDVETWHSFHPMDSRRFYEALAQIVYADTFCPEEMGSYFTERLGLAESDLNYQKYREAINVRVLQAEAIKEFMNFQISNN